METKRYVFDYANDIIKSMDDNDMMDNNVRIRLKARINTILADYKGGYITTREAMYCLAMVY